MTSKRTPNDTKHLEKAVTSALGRELPGMRWRLLAHGHGPNPKHGRLDLRFHPADRVEFDELVVGDWFHMEQMSARHWWVRVGDTVLNIEVRKDGGVDVRFEEDAA